MAAAHRPTPELPEHLRALYDRFPFARSVAEDPVSGLQRFRSDPKAAEVGGIFAATLAIGNTTAIRGAFADLLERADGDLVRHLVEAPPAERVRRLQGFRHRWIRGDQMAHLAACLKATYDSGQTLESVFAAGHSAGGFANGLDALAGALRGEAATSPPGYRILFPSPLDGAASPCKRLTLFVRWMVRTDPPDLGVWRTVPASELRIPLDLHTYWIAYHLGLTARRTRSWKTVEEVTAALRLVDALDPVKYDFVLCHTGISGDCPKHRDLSVCGPCVVRPDCRLWRGRRAA
ncbi:MAG TPA: TIGR02757 family protein [Thermoplasmata archaeon]|nr:TIGR02757 family protein [Thermoplasmata archaeon]